MEAYSDFAAVYDEFMDNTPYEEWAERLDLLIQKYGISGKRPGGMDAVEDGTTNIPGSVVDSDLLLDSERNLVLDLGCGTGTLTELMYNKGYDMIGVDLSESMLNIAMEKRESSGAEILYLLQDMRELELYSTVGTVFSVCDSLNYILEANGLVPGRDVTIVSFDANRKALEMVAAGEISYDVECNPLHGPRVRAVIEQLERGETPPRFTYVEETAFDAVGLTQELIDSRGY